MNGIGIEKYVFISYKSEEKARADEIQKFLEQNGIRCWKAPESLHNRGTQDYNSDIIDAIRKCGCLLFLMSNKALCSDWVRKEVKYALEKCHKPVIPYVVDPIPAEKYDSDELVISLSLLKQILNENQANDLSVLLPYVRTSLGVAVRDEDGDSKNGVDAANTNCGGFVWHLTEAEFNLLLAEADFHIAKVNVLAKTDYLAAGQCPFGMVRQDLTGSVRAAAVNLIRAMSAIVDGTVECDHEKARSIVQRLYKLTFDRSKEFDADIFNLVEPFARRGDPWANFVLGMKFYHPSGGMLLNSQDSAFKCLSTAVKDTDNPYALILFGCCWQWGVGCDVSGTRAEFWYERAVSEGCVTAYAYLGRLYQFAPIGITRDPAQAEECFKKGVDAGDATAMYRYAEFLQREARYDESVEMYAKAYEHGYLVALADLATMAEVGYSPEDEKYKDKDLLRWRALSANLPSWKFLLAMEAKRNDPPFEDAAFAYAISGAGDRNANCADVLGDQIMAGRAAEHDRMARKSTESSLPERFGELWAFLTEEIAGDDGPAASGIRAVLGLVEAHGREEVVADLAGYDDDKPPKSCFWRSLVGSGLFPEGESGNPSAGLMPSELRYLNALPPYRFLETIRDYRARPGSALEKTQKIWSALRWLSAELVDVDQIANQRGMLLTSETAENTPSRIRGVVTRLRELFVMTPELSFWKDGRLESLSALPDKVDDRLLDIELNQKLKRALDDLFLSVRQVEHPSRSLKMAVLLWEDELFNSHPGLDLAIGCYYSSYLWGGSPMVGAKMATLFLVNNGRWRSPVRNEGLVYAVSSILKKSIYQKELSAIPPFLELMLFGFKAGNSVVESDFGAIQEAEAVIDEMTLPSPSDDDPYKSTLRFEVAYAMAKIYLDEGLYNGARCEQKLGASVLLDCSKATQWLHRAKKLLPDKGNPIFRQISEKIDQLTKRGFDILPSDVRRDIRAQVESEGPVEASSASGDDAKFVELVGRVTEIFGAMTTKVDVYPRVQLKDDLLDVAVSTDGTAVLLMLLQEDADFEVRRIEGDVCHGRILPVDGVIGTGFVEMLGRLKETLHEMEPEANVEIGVVAGGKMLGRIADCLGPEVESRGLNLFSYDDLGSQLDAVFAKYGDDGSSAETEEDGEKNPE